MSDAAAPASLNNAQIAAAAAVEEECTAEFATRVNLDKVEVVDGEKDEDAIFTDRCAMYRFDDENKEWKERARGDVQLLKHKTTGKIRVLMRQEKTLFVRMNHFVPAEVALKPNAGSEKAWTWRCPDAATESGELETYSFALRFRTAQVATEFNDKWEEGRKANAGGEGKAAEEAAPKEEEAAPAADKKDEEKPAAEEPKKEEEAAAAKAE